MVIAPAARSSSPLRRASIVPVDPNTEPALHRFSLLRERASEETIFVQEICDAEGHRWSWRVPASGLRENMVHILEELEKRAVELGRTLSKMVVTCLAESLSMKLMGQDAAAVNSSELLHPPAVGDEILVGYNAGPGLKNRIIDPERGTDEPGARPSEPSSESVQFPAHPRRTCHRHAYISLSSHPSSYQAAQLLQPSNSHTASPTRTIQYPCECAFSAPKEPQPTSSIAERLIMPHSTKTDSESRAATATASEAMPPFLFLYRVASEVLRRRLWRKAAVVTVAATDDRHRGCWASLSKTPPPRQPEILKASSAAPQQQQNQTPPSCAPGNAPHQDEQPRSDNNRPKWYRYGCAHPPTSTSTPCTSKFDTRTVPITAAIRSEQGASSRGYYSATLGLGICADATGRKLRHLFRRPPGRSASDPPSYPSM